MLKTFKKSLLTCTLVSLACGSFSNANANTKNHTSLIKTQGSGLADIVPNNWNILDSKKGDINNDGIEDLVFVIQDTDKTKILNNGVRKRDANPRILAIYNGTHTGYTQQQLVADFIPLKDNPGLMEPFNEDFEGIEITDKGVLQLTFSYFMNSGGWGMSKETFKIQYRDDDYQLIGYDNHSIQRNTLEITDYSYNFLYNTIIKSHYYDGEDDMVEGSGEEIFHDRKVHFDLDEPFTLNNINELNYTVKELLDKNRQYPKAKGATLADVIPQNWKILSKTTGDLNQDDIQDVVVTIQDTDEDNLNQKYDYNNNPKLIAVYFGSSNGLIKHRVYSDTRFNDYQSNIDNKGVLEFSQKSDNDYGNDKVREVNVFKFQLRNRFSEQLASTQPNRVQNDDTNQKFLLIGFNGYKTIEKTKSKIEEASSVNFLTRKAIYNNNGEIDVYNFRLNQLSSLDNEIDYLHGTSPLETIEQWRVD